MTRGERSNGRPVWGKSPSRTLLALFISLVCPTGQIIASLHEASVRHVICAEHGELAHVGASGVADAASARTDNSASVRGEASETSHEHCPHAGVLRRQRTLDAPQVGLAPVLVLTAAVGEPARYVAPSTRLLLSAPKTSPPVA